MYKIITDWSEVWALLIPLFFLFRRLNNRPYLKPVRIYVLTALVINIWATVIQQYNATLDINPKFFSYSNNFLYNIHSVIRLLMFSWFFILLQQDFLSRIKKLIPLLFLLIFGVNFIFFENFFDHNNLSSRLLAAEAATLLFYCSQYYVYMLMDDKSTSVARRPGIWIVIGLTFYVAASFFIFLFYSYLTEYNANFAVDIWDVHNFFYLVLCTCIAINFARSDEK